jgi:hypothetical protein
MSFVEFIPNGRETIEGAEIQEQVQERPYEGWVKIILTLCGGVRVRAWE